MPKGKINDTFCSKATEGAWWDTDLKGFGLIVRPTGTKSLVYQQSGKTRRTLGRWPVLRAADARRMCMVEKAVWMGEAPPQAPPSEMTLREAVAEHIEDMQYDGRTSQATMMDVMERHLGPWLDRKLCSFTREEVKAKHRQMAKHPATANLTFRMFRAAWNTARSTQEDLPESPTSAVKWYRVEGRDTTVQDLTDWHERVDTIPNPIIRDWARFTLGTGLRISDSLCIRLSEVDFDAATLRRPSPKGGPRAAFVLPLSTQLMEIAERRREWGGIWMWPSLRQNGHMTNPKSSLVNAGLSTKVHDLRRTYATTALKVHCPQTITKMLMNHSTRDVTEGYQHLSIDDLRPWQQKISDVLFLESTTV